MIKTNLIRSSDSHYIKYKNEKIEEFIDCLKESKLPKLYIDISKQKLKFDEIIENYKKTTIANSKNNTNENILTNIKMKIAINDKVGVEQTKENLPMKRNKIEENQVGNINDLSLINFAEEDDNEDSIQNVFSIKKKSKLGLGFDNER